MPYRKLLMTTAISMLSIATLSVTAAAAQDRPQTPPPAQTPPSAPQAPAGQTPPAPTQQTPPAEDADGEEEETAVEEVVVQAARTDIVARSDRMSYNITNDLQAQSGSVADALRNVPGVEVDLQGNVSLRGDSNVTILIDGRPSGMLSGGSRADALQAMSASGIERVEVITNPSAAFSPEGSGGIINLVSKPTRAAQQSGTVRGQWDFGDRGNVSLSGSRSQDGLTLAGDVGFRRQTGEIELVQSRDRDGPTPATTFVEDTTFNAENAVQMANGRLAVDYDLNARDRLSGELSVRDMQGDNQGVGTFERSDGTGAVTDRYVRASDTEFGNTGVSARTSWRRKFSGDQHELVTDFEYDSNESEGRGDTVFDTTAGAGADYVQTIRNTNERDAWGLKIDYTRPVGEGHTLKLGYEGDLSEDSFDNYGARGPTAAMMTPVASLTNLFDYDQTIHAFYATYDRPFGEDLTLQAGLRVEQVDFRLDQITDGIVVERDYLRAYPTIHMGYQLTETQRLRGSYSRRIARPSPQDLNPYTIYVDPQNLRRGNPDLDPEITDSFELSWQMRSGQTFYSATAFYRKSEGGVTDVAVDQGNGIVLTTRQNLSEGERTGVEFIANGKLGDQVSYNVSGTVLRNDIFVPGFTGGQSGTTGTARASLNWQPTPKDFFQLNGFYIGEQIQAQGAREAFGQLNIGYRRKVTDDFSLILTGANILDSAEMTTRIDTPDFSDRSTVRFGEPTYFIGFTWNFGGGQRRQEPAFDFGQQTPG